MESFQLSFGIMMPMFLTLATGWCLRYFQVLQTPGFDVISMLRFKVLLPVPLFCSICEGGDLRLLDGRMLVWALVCQVLILLLLFLIVPRIFEKNPVRASIIQVCLRSNFITFGMVIARELGLSGELMVVPVLAGVPIPLYNTDGVGILGYYRGGELEPRRMTKQAGGNPFVIGCIISLILVVLKIKLSVYVKTTLGDMASYMNPTSFLALDGCLNLMSVGSYKKEILAGMGYRLVFQPAAFLRLSYLLGFRGTEFPVSVAMLISSTTVVIYDVTWSINTDRGLAGRLAVFQSLGSVMTIFLWIFLLSGPGVL